MYQFDNNKKNRSENKKIFMNIRYRKFHFKSMQVILLFIKTKKKKKLMYATFNFFFNLMVE